MNMKQFKSMTKEQKVASLSELSLDQLIEFNGMSEKTEEVHTYKTTKHYHAEMRKFIFAKLEELGKPQPEGTYLKKDFQKDFMRRYGQEWFATHQYVGQYPESAILPETK